MTPMGDDAGIIFAALSQRLRREQSKSQALQRELQVLRSSEAMTFDIQVCPHTLWNPNACVYFTLGFRLLLKLKNLSSGSCYRFEAM